jgi:hypothetical protein
MAYSYITICKLVVETSTASLLPFNASLFIFCKHIQSENCTNENQYLALVIARQVCIISWLKVHFVIIRSSHTKCCFLHSMDTLF